jgi:hypothetical protein
MFVYTRWAHKKYCPIIYLDINYGSTSLYYKGRKNWEQFSPNVKHTHHSQRTHVSGKAHPKELDETWDSQIFRYSKMFPPKSANFFHREASLPARAYPSPIQPTNHARRRFSSVSFLFYYAHSNTRLLSVRRVVANLFSPDPRDHRGPFSPSSPSANLLSFHSTIQASFVSSGLDSDRNWWI